MRLVSCLLLFFSFLMACQNPVSGPGKKDPDTGVPGNLPFDKNGQLIFTKHARCRMDCRHITAKEIHEVLDQGNINYSKSQPDGHPDPKYAVEGYTAEQQHLRIIVAPEGEKLIIVTCIEIGVEWSCNCN